MSEKPISVGDLVVVVRGHSCVVNILGGVPFVVTALLNPIGGGWYCSKCHTYSAGPDETAAEGATRKGCGIPLSYLKRIPPLSELEGERTDEKLREPA